MTLLQNLQTVTPTQDSESPILTTNHSYSVNQSSDFIFFLRFLVVCGKMTIFANGIINLKQK